MTALEQPAKPPVYLDNGNGLKILRRCSLAIIRLGDAWSYARGKAWMKKARSLHYDELLAFVGETFSVTFGPKFSKCPDNWGLPSDDMSDEFELSDD